MEDPTPPGTNQLLDPRPTSRASFTTNLSLLWLFYLSPSLIVRSLEGKCAMRRTSPCVIIHSFNYPTLPTFLFVLLCLPSFASARLPIPRWLPSASPDALDAPTNRLSPRQTHLPYPNEHVVLADCTQGTERHLTSQMAQGGCEPYARVGKSFIGFGIDP